MNGRKAKLLKKAAKAKFEEYQRQNPGQFQLTYKAYPKKVTPEGLLVSSEEEYPINHVRRIFRAMVRAERLAKMGGKK
jgi:hypothetical protein